MNNWDNKNTKELCSALLLLENEKEAMLFLRDLLTEPEIIEFGSRFKVAKELNSGKPQRKVSLETGVSIATVTRVNQWLKRGMGGYRLVLEKLKDHQSKSRLIMKSKI
jgi:TrpR-related protein YerC/YecD